MERPYLHQYNPKWQQELAYIYHKCQVLECRGLHHRPMLHHSHLELLQPLGCIIQWEQGRRLRRLLRQRLGRRLRRLGRQRRWQELALHSQLCLDMALVLLHRSRYNSKMEMYPMTGGPTCEYVRVIPESGLASCEICYDHRMCWL